MATSPPPKILLAKLGCDIHERGVLTLVTSFRNAGMEVIYTGRYQTPERVANVAMSEDVDVLALSDHTGSLPIIAASILDELRKIGCDDIPVVAGGLLSPADIEALHAMGVSGNYGPGTPMDVIISHVRDLSRGRRLTDRKA